jgi:hypothetical protein
VYFSSVRRQDKHSPLRAPERAQLKLLGAGGEVDVVIVGTEPAADPPHVLAFTVDWEAHTCALGAPQLSYSRHETAIPIITVVALLFQTHTVG